MRQPNELPSLKHSGGRGFKTGPPQEYLKKLKKIKISIGQPVLGGANIVIVPCRVCVFDILMNCMSCRLVLPA